MIKQWYENRLLRQKQDRAQLEMNLRLYEQAGRGVQRLSESHDPRQEERDQTPTSDIPGSHDNAYILPHDTEELIEVIRECRNISHSPFAQSAIENRINYVFGDGFTYTFMGKNDQEQEDLSNVANELLEQFFLLNNWQDKQAESQRRLDRDGEVFQMYKEVSADEGYLQLRYIEPEYVVPPAGNETGDFSWGIKTKEDDIETVLQYRVEIGDNFKENIDAEEIQHRKVNTDSTYKRGYPTLASVRSNLKSANKVLRNAGTVAGIQAAIALIRRHATTAPKIQGAIQAQEVGKDSLGRSVLDIPEGAIIDTTGGSEYDFPATSVNPGNIVGIIQADLRAVGARFQMPEFLISSDASNANYSSTLVSEGPFVRSIQKIQRTTITAERETIGRFIDEVIKGGLLPENFWDVMMLDISAPSLVVRNFKEEADIASILIREKISSVERQAKERFGIDDYDAEREVIESEDSLFGDMVPQNPFDNLPSQSSNE